MSWGFMRGSAWRFLQSPQFNTSASRGSFSAPNIFFDELQENVSSADGSTSGEEDLDSLVLFGMLRGNVVGLRYYTGVVNNNEMVALQREPSNPYDRNAVKVNNVNGEQVGHIRKELAAALAQIMDRKLVRIEGIVPYGAHNAFTMPVNLSFWGQEESKKVVLDHMKKYGYKLEPVPKSFGTSSMSQGAGSGQSASLPAVRLTVEQLKTEFDKLFEDLKEDDKTQELEPAKSVQTVLLPHQKQALAWMVSRENNTELPLFWEQRNNLYYNTLTNFAEKKRPESIRGGILADDMGLGKTLSMIALILTNFHDGQPLPTKKVKSGKQIAPNKSLTSDSGKPSRNKDSQGLCSGTNEIGNSQDAKGTSSKRRKPRKAKCDFSDSEEDWLPRKTKSTPACSFADDQFALALSGASPGVKKKSKKKVIDETTVQSDSKCGGKLPRPTLIVCPLSVMSNWIDQFEHHVQAEVDLKIYVYYGPERSRDQKTLSQQDVVLTSYSTVAYDYGTNNSPLHKIKWLRVVLDEGHTIRNPNAQQTKAIHSLDAVRRWVLSGTPIQNSLKDIWSILSFLKLKPFNEREWWHRTIQRPVTTGNQEGLRRLQTIIKYITLRRTKTTKVNGKPVLELPERKVYIQYIKLSTEERHIYESMQNEGKAIIGRYFDEGSVLTHYADVLAVLVRLRQLCCHPYLVQNNFSSASAVSSTPEELRVKLVNKIKLVLNSGSDEECSICLDSLNLPVITHCAHVFCKPCICQVIHSEKPNAKCPLCRSEIRLEHLLECPEEDLDSSTKKDQKWISSSKIEALMCALIEQRKKDPHVKSIIVSQFTSYLSLIESALGESGFMFTRLDGSMTQKKRTEAIQTFQSTDVESPTIMLLSLKAGGVGLNLTAASRVFLMDPAWNPAAEEQCFDRCHRLGQTKEVIVTKFVVKDSVEENMLKIQDKKRELAAGAFGTNKPSASEIKQTRINEIRTLVNL